MKQYFWLICLVVLAGFLRFYHLTIVPPALNSDEVAIGYNAYSVLKTGRDEYGVTFPAIFRSFDDYKMPLYVYLVVGSIRLFGYNDFSVRFPSALAGTATVLLTYFLVLELMKRRDIALVATLFVAISPWSLQFSRAGYEANMAVCFIVFGAYLFLLGLKKGRFLVASSVMFSLSVWTYLTPRIFVPLLVLGLAGIYRKELWKQKKGACLGIFVAVALLFPIIRMSLSSQGQLRAAGVSAFANPDDIKRSVSRMIYDRQHGLSMFTVLDNRRLLYVMTFLRGYFSHFRRSM